MSWSKLWEIVKDREAWRAAVMGLQRLGHNLATKQQSSRSLANIFSHSHYIDSFLYCATFDVVPFVYFYFCFPCLKRHIKKNVRLMSKSVIPMFPSMNFIVSGHTFICIIHFEYIFLIVWNNSPIWIFAHSSLLFPSTIYRRDCLYPTVYFCLLCHRLIYHLCMGLFLGSLYYCSNNMCLLLCQYHNLDYYSLVRYFEIREHNSSIFVVLSLDYLR